MSRELGHDDLLDQLEYEEEEHDSNSTITTDADRDFPFRYAQSDKAHKPNTNGVSPQPNLMASNALSDYPDPSAPSTTIVGKKAREKLLQKQKQLTAEQEEAKTRQQEETYEIEKQKALEFKQKQAAAKEKKLADEKEALERARQQERKEQASAVNPPNTPPPQLKPTPSVPTNSGPDLIIPTANNTILLDENNAPMNKAQANVIKSYQTTTKAPNNTTNRSDPIYTDEEYHKYGRQAEYLAPARHTGHRVSIQATPTPGRVDPLLHHRPTQSIRSSPPPPDLYSAELPVVNRRDITFHVEHPFPATATEQGSRIVYYFPIIVTATYRYKYKSPLALTLSTNPQTTLSLMSSTGSLSAKSSDFVETVVHEYSHLQQFKLGTKSGSPHGDETHLQTESWTVNIRFSEFDAVYQHLAALYPTLAPQLSKIPSPQADVKAIQRRPMLQDLINQLYSIPFVQYDWTFLQLFQIPQYVTLYPLHPLVPLISHDLHGNCYKHHLQRDLSGATSIEPKRMDSAQTFPSQYSYGFNHGYCRPTGNVLFTPVQYNSLMNKVNNLSSWFSGPSLVKKCDIKKANGGVIAWVYNDSTEAWGISSILPLDCNVDYVTSQFDNVSKHTVYIGCSNGQLVTSQWNAGAAFSDFTPSFAHNGAQICGLFTSPSKYGSFISVARDGTIIFHQSNASPVEINMNLGESLLSSTLVKDRWLICGADSGYVFIIDCDYPITDHAPSRDPHRLHHGFNPKMIYCSQHHSNGIRYIASTTVPLSSDVGQLFKNPRYNHIMPYNDLKLTFDQPYSVEFANTNATGSNSQKQTTIHHGLPDQNFASTINQSAFTATNALQLENESDIVAQQQQNQYVDHTTTPNQPTITFIITCSHDGTNGVFILNENRSAEANGPQNYGQGNPAYYPPQNQQHYQQQQNGYKQPDNSNIPLSPNAVPISALHTRALLPLHTLKSHPSHCAVFCTGRQTQYFITAHDENKTRLLVWDSNALESGPIHVITTANKQITTMIWFSDTNQLMTTSRDGVITTFSFDQIFKNYEANQI